MCVLKITIKDVLVSPDNIIIGLLYLKQSAKHKGLQMGVEIVPSRDVHCTRYCILFLIFQVLHIRIIVFPERHKKICRI